MNSRLAIALMLLVPALASAQSIVVPGAHATAEAGTFSVWPCSTGASSYQLYLHRSQMNAWSTGVQLTGIAFRMNGGENTYMTDLNYASYEVTVSDSSSASFAANALASTTYADNIGPNSVVARSGPLHIVPGTLIGGVFPVPFAYTIDFTTPYSYTSGTDIVLTIRHSSGGTPAADARVDAITEAAGISWGLFSSGAASVTGQHGNAAVVRLVTVPTPNIALSRVGGGGVVDGGTDTILSSYAGTALPLTFTVTNQGDAPLTLTGGTPLSFGNEINCGVAIQQPLSGTVAPAANTTFQVTITPTAIGAWSVDVELANNDPDESPYNFTIAGTAAAGGEIVVLRGTTDIADGGADSGNTTGSLSLTYTIRNDGNQNLNITGPVATGAMVNCTVIVTQPAVTAIAPTASTTFALAVTPTAEGAFSFTVSIPNDDADENPFNFNFTGTRQPTPADKSDGGGGCIAGATGTPALLLLALAGARRRRR